MNTSCVSLDRYLQDPLSGIPKGFSSNAADCFLGFLSKWSCVDICKWQTVSNAQKQLIQSGHLAKFRVHLLFTQQNTAYMNDSGDMYLSFGLLSKHSSLSVLSVFCHELSHLKLSQSPQYPAIKALQREFKQRFGDRDRWELMSPIEVYAMYLSCGLMKEIAHRATKPSHKQKLAMLIDDLEDKIVMLKQDITCLCS